MGIPVGVKYTQQVSGAFPIPFQCASCGFQSVAMVQSRGEGEGSAMLWIDKAGAQDRASDEAQKNARKSAEEIAHLGECPQCNECDMAGRRSLRARYTFKGLLLVPVASSLFWVLTMLRNMRRGGELTFMVVAGGVAGLVMAMMYISKRSWMWNDVDNRVRVMSAKELQAAAPDTLHRSSLLESQ